MSEDKRAETAFNEAARTGKFDDDINVMSPIARRGYARKGRGAIVITADAQDMVIYATPADLAALKVPLPRQAELLEAIASYDPEHEFVFRGSGRIEEGQGATVEMLVLMPLSDPEDEE